MATRKLTRKELLRRKRLKLRRRRQKRAAALILIAVAIIAIVLLLVLRKPANDENIAAALPAETPVPTQQATPEPTVEPTPEITPEPTPEPTPEVYIPINLYAPDDEGVRYRLSEYVSNWKRGKDIDCFEALASDSETLKGKNFYEICKEAWGTLPNPYTMKIGYTLRYNLADGSEVRMTIQSPDDITHTEYVECYLYDDVHNAGKFYTHLSESNMKENTLITSIKITCGDKIDQVQDMHLGVFLYETQDQFDAAGNYTGAWYSEIEISRKS